MRLSESVVLRFRYNGSTILVNVSLVHGLTWRWVAKEVLRFHLLSLDTEVRKKQGKYISVSTILAPNNESLNLNERLLYYDVKSFLSGTFTLFTNGPWCILSDAHLLHIYTFLSFPKDLNSLLRISHRFRKLFMSDKVWKYIPFTACPWQGEGDVGTESVDWCRVHEDTGLSIITSHRLRWIAHNTSRLKLFYGSVPESNSLGLMRFLFRKEVPTLQNVRNTISILGEKRARYSTKLFMRKMHYLVPESATQFHTRTECKPLLDHGVLFDLEPSPIDCRSRNLSCDPGTRVEGKRNNHEFAYRRIGDPRLTFLSLDLATDRPRVFLPYDDYFTLTTKTVGNILLVEYNEADLESMQRQLEVLWSALQYHFGATAPSYAADWELHKAARFAICDTPVLIFLAIDWSSWVPLQTPAADYTQSACYRTGIQRCVSAVHAMMKRLTSNGFAHHHPRTWYIQPIDAKAAENKLNCGLFPGVNWLLRAVIARQQRK